MFVFGFNWGYTFLFSKSEGYTAWKVSKYRVISGPYFSEFSPNTGKYGPEIILYLDTFHAVIVSLWKAIVDGLI